MENEKFKKFIEENRSAFEEESPSENVWSRIDKKLSAKEPKMVPLRLVISYAAAAVIVIGFAFYLVLQAPEQSELMANEKTTKEEFLLASVSPEYAEMENYYRSRIHFTMSELTNYQPDEEMMMAVQDLDAEYKKLQEEMKSNINRDEIIEAMIENYRLKLYLLEQILETMKENAESTTNTLISA